MTRANRFVGATPAEGRLNCRAEIVLARNYRYSGQQLNEIESLVEVLDVVSNLA